MFQPYCRGVTKSSHSLKGGAQKVLPCLEGGGGAQKVSDPRFSHFVAPPLPVINDQSLKHFVEFRNPDPSVPSPISAFIINFNTITSEVTLWYH